MSIILKYIHRFALSFQQLKTWINVKKLPLLRWISLEKSLKQFSSE